MFPFLHRPSYYRILTLLLHSSFVATATGVSNTPNPDPEPLTNLTGIYPGPLNPNAWIPFVAPVLSNRFGRTFIRQGMDMSVTKDTVGAPITITYAVSVPFVSWISITRDRHMR